MNSCCQPNSRCSQKHAKLFWEGAAALFWMGRLLLLCCLWSGEGMGSTPPEDNEKRPPKKRCLRARTPVVLPEAIARRSLEDDVVAQSTMDKLCVCLASETGQQGRRVQFVKLFTYPMYRDFAIHRQKGIRKAPFFGQILPTLRRLIFSGFVEDIPTLIRLSRVSTSFHRMIAEDLPIMYPPVVLARQLQQMLNCLQSEDRRAASTAMSAFLDYTRGGCRLIKEFGTFQNALTSGIDFKKLFGGDFFNADVSIRARWPQFTPRPHSQQEELIFYHKEIFLVPITIQGLGYLTRITFQDCGLYSFPKIAFPNLNTLILSRNNITFLDLTIYPKLQVLQVDRNNLREVFLPLSISFALLSQNRLRRLDASSCQRLETLDASCNQLGSVRLPHGLKTLKLAQNRLGSLRIGYLHYLQALDLSQNQLTKVGLYWLPALTQLSICDNPLTSIDAAHVPHLVALNLRNTALVEVPFLVSQAFVLERLHMFRQDFPSHKIWLPESLETVSLPWQLIVDDRVKVQLLKLAFLTKLILIAQEPILPARFSIHFKELMQRRAAFWAQQDQGVGAKGLKVFIKHGKEKVEVQVL